MTWLDERLRSFGDRPIAIDATGHFRYDEFADRILEWAETVEFWGISPGQRVGIVADDEIDAVALLLALLEQGCIVIPLSPADRAKFAERVDVAQINNIIYPDCNGCLRPETVRIDHLGDPIEPLNPLLAPMARDAHPGFVIFTSGSTGREKAVLLDYCRMTRKYRDEIRPSHRTLLFLTLDHIGGLNTLFSVILNGGTIITSSSRQASDICRCIEQFRVELLPTTPSFLTMMLMSGVYRNYDLSSLKIITYGTEVMPNSTLKSLHDALPDVELKQTYGLSELGILATKSPQSSSPWVKIGGDDFEIKVVDGTLWVRSQQAMIGYLNAPSPFHENGWYNTGDKVEVDGDYIRILGRESEIINVGGEKVYPIEVESFLLTLDNVQDVVVRKKDSPVLGQLVWADFLLDHSEDERAFRRRILSECQSNLPAFKVPGLITITDRDSLIGSRFKKVRKSGLSTQSYSSAPGEHRPRRPVATSN